MPEVIDPPTLAQGPPARLAPFCFNHDSARLAGQRSAALRAERKANAPALSTPNAEPQSPPNASASAINAQLSIVQSQITRTLKVLNATDYHYCEHCERGDIEPHHRAQLLKALDSLLDRQRVLLGIPLPGSLKPSSNREPRRRVAELLPLPTASPIPSSQPMPAPILSLLPSPAAHLPSSHPAEGPSASQPPTPAV